MQVYFVLRIQFHNSLVNKLVAWFNTISLSLSLSLSLSSSSKTESYFLLIIIHCLVVNGISHTTNLPEDSRGLDNHLLLSTHCNCSICGTTKSSNMDDFV